MSKCATCIYGGIKIDTNATYVFKQVNKTEKGKMVALNYDAGDYGCRADAFWPKEQVCLNNNFSEYRTE